MARTVSTATDAKLADKSYEPGFLVELRLSSIVRYSTRGDVTWNGQIYVRSVLAVAGLEDDSSAGTLTFDDPTLAIASLVRVESLIGKPVSVARFYSGALGTTDPIWFFSGCIESAREDKRPRVVLGLSRVAAQRSMTPPRRVSIATGFKIVQPEGSLLRWRQQSYRLERARR